MASRTGKSTSKKASQLEEKVKIEEEQRELRPGVRLQRPNYNESESSESDEFHETMADQEVARAIKEGFEAAQKVTNLSFKLPDFWETQPAAWFKRVELEFIRRKISSDDEKAACIFNALKDEQARCLTDLLENSPSTGFYDAIKKQLIRKFGKTRQVAFDNVFSFKIPEIPEGKLPSELMEDMIMDSTPEFVATKEFRILFLRRLPKSIAANANDQESLTDLRELAEKCDQLLAAVSVCTPAINNVEQSAEPSEANAVFRGQRGRFGRGRGNFRGNQSRGGLSRQPPKSGICYYHWKFGHDAEERLCKQPCDFLTKNPQGRRN